MDNSKNVHVHFGNLLKEARIRQNISLENVAEDTRININNLIALEEGDRKQLPADVFIRGFIKLYADYLGIASEDIIALFDDEWGGTPSKSNKSLGRELMAEPLSIFADRQFLLFLLIILLAAACFFSYNFFSRLPMGEEHKQTTEKVSFFKWPEIK